MNIEEKLLQVAREFTKKMSDLSKLRMKSIGKPIPQVVARVFGQSALFLNKAARENLLPVMTQDLDVQFEGGVEREILKSDLQRAGLDVDSESDFIWVVPEAEFDTIFETEFVKIEAVQPLYNLASKAVKAPEKNKILIRRGLLQFGNELYNLILKYGGDLEQFK